MPYLPIDDYGLIGNMRSAALVGCNGSIDWLCLPRFDSPSIFAAILDERRGGSFSIAPAQETVATDQYYLPDTNVLVRRSRCDGTVAEVIDFMPVCSSHHAECPPDLVRLVRCVHGRFTWRMRCQPAFDYARAGHRMHRYDGGVVFEGDGGSGFAALSSTVELRPDGDGVGATVELAGGEAAVFALSYDNEGDDLHRRLPVNRAEELLRDTVDYWLRWMARCTYRGRWSEAVHRSALVLKLLTFEPTGAIVAAPTCSLPEHIGGSRNWDYRYTWLRDAAFTVYALLRIGFHDEAAAFMRWLQQRSHEMGSNGMLRPLYGIDGRHEIDEVVLDHLEGYRGSSPVRIGNAACDQLQLDVSGMLLDAAYLHNKHAVPLSWDMWVELRKLLDWVCRNWQRPDNGIWEVRGERRHFVFSKLMCWVALDRGLRLARVRAFPGSTDQWQRNRDMIYEEIMSRGWNDDRQTFVQHYETDALDAANLMMPLVFFISPDDPRMQGMIRQMRRPLVEGGLVSDFLVHRYRVDDTDDGIREPEGAFNICTFWMIDGMIRARTLDAARLGDARLLFERMLRCGSPLGLFGEQTSLDGATLGNYPQGLTHLSLITAAYNLDAALNRRGG